MKTESERGCVWVLEDSALEAEMARRSLTPSHDVELFADGAALLERLEHERKLPDVVVVDWQLPGVSGVELCRSVRLAYDSMTLPLLMLTVQGRKEDVVEGLASGANDYVTKPYDVSELVARVGTLVRASHLHRLQRERSRELALAAELGTALARADTPRETARRCAEALARHVDATTVEIWSSVGPTGGLTRLATIGSDAHPVPDTLIEHVARSGQPVVTDGRVEAEESIASLPLVSAGEVVGVVALAARHPLVHSSRSLATAADLLAAGIARVRLEDERKQSLLRERNARAEAEAANRSKDEFLAMVSHELRTPLNAISGWTTLLLEGGISADRAKRALEVIHRNARAQAQLIDDLLDISRITSGRLRLEVSPVDVPAIAITALETVRLASESKGVHLEIDVDPTAGRVQGDPARVQQVIWNLLSNAMKFTPAGGTVTLHVRRTEDSIEVSVEDTGQGISPEFLPYVFDRFKQADSSATRNKGGLGLGLAIVRHLVELHGGTAEATSAGVGKGATFTVRFPYGPRARDLADVPLRGVASGVRAALQGVRVLVVDDEKDSRELLQTMLESCEADVTVTASAAEAYEAVQRLEPDVLVSDLAMPGEDGVSLIRRVRALPAPESSRVRAVAVSAYARLEDRERALSAGFDAHVAKPVDPDNLLSVVGDLVATR